MTIYLLFPLSLILLQQTRLEDFQLVLCILQMFSLHYGCYYYYHHRHHHHHHHHYYLFTVHNGYITYIFQKITLPTYSDISVDF